MAKSSKGQEFLENYTDKENQIIYDLVRRYKGQSEYEIANIILENNNIKLTWQDAATETKKA